MSRLFYLIMLSAAAAMIVAGCDLGGVSSGPVPPKPTGHVQEGIRVGDRAPEIQGKDADDEPFKLSDYRGRVVLLDFWFER